MRLASNVVVLLLQGSGMVLLLLTQLTKKVDASSTKAIVNIMCFPSLHRPHVSAASC